MSVGVVAQRASIPNEYNTAEQELQDRVLDIYGTRENEVDLFRPALADSQKIGFFSLDRSCQTEKTEIVDLKEMTEVIQVLLEDASSIRRDITFNKSVMQADYRTKIQDKSVELYCRINEKVVELEKFHQERMTCLRKAYKQQLSNAVTKLALCYKNDCEEKLKKVKSEQQGTREGEWREMQATIQRNESFIQLLQMQLAQYQQTGFNTDAKEAGERGSSMDKRRDDVSVLTGSTMDKSRNGVISVPTGGSQSVTPVNAKSIDVDSEEVLKQEKKIANLEEGIEIRENELLELKLENVDLKNQLKKNQVLIEQVNQEKSMLKISAGEANLKAKRQAEEEIDKHKKEMDRIMKERLKEAQKEAQSNEQVIVKTKVKTEAAEAMAKIQTLEKEKEHLTKHLEEEKAIMEGLNLQGTKEAALNAAKKHSEAEAERLRLIEQKMMDGESRLKREIEKIHQTWEKKFAILQRSMFVLKDESYLRQTLQKQSTNLPQAAVSYAVDSPASGRKTKPTRGRGGMAAMGGMVKKTLPDINKIVVKSGKGGRSLPSGVGEKDYISYTVSVPSERASAAFSVDEHQITSETELELPPNIVPLPSPPPTNEEENVNPKHRVIVVPTEVS